MRKLIVACALLLAAPAHAAIPPSQRDALVALYQSTHGENWVGKLNWLGAPGTECTWYGVTCSDGDATVRAIDLSSNNLAGALPPQIGQLSDLQSLYLVNDELTGPIPHEIGNLKSLEYLGLNDNHLDGSLPPTIGGLSAIINIDLSTNLITGSIPSSLSGLTEATIISLANNRLSGPIPTELASLTKLEILSLANNELTGAIPPELGDMTSLTVLQLQYNKLTGGIPSQLGKLRNLQQLELGNNDLGGTIPFELGDLSALTVLDLTTAGLTGTIPPHIYDLAKLEQLRLADNDLEGTLDGVTKLRELAVLELYFNRLTGSIPAELRNLTHLADIGLNGNALTGPIPDGIGDLTGLTSFDIGSNRMSGPIPASFASLENLEYADLGNNELTGALPDFSRLDKLWYLSVEHNFLTGAIPPSIGGLTSLVDALFAGNNFTGTLPPEIGRWTKAWYVDLSDNQLEGAIPAEIGALKEMYGLFLFSNRFSGTIPREIGQLTSLQSLYLNYNALRGPIPTEIRNLTALIDHQSAFEHNLLFSGDADVRAFVNLKQAGDEGFESTQTVTPSNVQVSSTTDRSATLTWTPIVYTSDDGGYQVTAATTPNGAPVVIATTNTKDAATITVRNLDASTSYFFTVSTVTHPHDYQKNLLVSDASAARQGTTTQRVVAPPDVVVTEAPDGLVQIDGTGVADDSFTLTNFGDTATVLTLAGEGDFFTAEPAQFQLAGGASRVVTLKSRPQPAGSYWGRVVVNGTGAELAVDVVMLAVARPSGFVSAQPLTSRVEVFGDRGLESIGSVQFRNTGTAKLAGVVVSDQPWVIPNPQPVSIEPGSIGTVNFRVVRARRPEGAEGALVANLSLVYVDGGGQALLPLLGGLATAPPPGVSVSIVTVVDVTKPPVAPGSVPALGPGEVSLIIAGVANRNNVRSDLSLLNAASGAAINDLRLYFTSGAGTSIASLLPLGASKGVSLVNIVNIYGATNAAGTLQVRSSSNWQNVAADAKATAVTPDGGTLGGSIPVFRGDRATPVNGKVYLAGLTRPGDLVVQETSGAASLVAIEFLDAGGNTVGDIVQHEVGAGALLELRDAVPANAITAIVTNLRASSTIVAYARATDASGDAWSIVDWSALHRFNRTDAMRVPFIDGKTQSAGGGKRRAARHASSPQPRTDVVLFNPTAGEARATLRVIDTAGNPSEREVLIGARQTIVVTGAGAAASTPTAHLVIEPRKGEVVVTARSLVPAPSGSGAVGTAIPVLAATAGLRLGQMQVFSALEDSAAFRTSYGFAETSGAAVRVRARILIDQDHALATAATSRTFDLAPRQQIVLPELMRSFAGDARDTLYGDLHDLTLQIEVLSGSGSVVPFLIVTDNATADSVMRTQ